MDSKPTLSQQLIRREVDCFITKVSRPPQQPRERRISEIFFFCIAERRTENEVDQKDL